MHTYIHQKLRTGVFIAPLFLRTPTLEATQKPIDHRRGPENVYLHNGITHSSENHQFSAAHDTAVNLTDVIWSQEARPRACMLDGAISLKYRNKPNESLLFDIRAVITLGLGWGGLDLEGGLRGLCGSL